jgi:hypothetical protein
MPSNTFLTRIAAERQGLAAVNAYATGPRQLTGLTWEALSEWQRRIALPEASVLLKCLREYSDSCQRLSDRSHETVHHLSQADASRVEAHLAQLRWALEQTFGH